MKKFLCSLSAFAVFILSGCASQQSESPLFDKYTADGTDYPVKIVWQEGDVLSSYYIASPDKFYISYDFGNEKLEAVFDSGTLYNISHEEKAAFASELSAEDKSAVGEGSIGYIPAYPEKWVLLEKGEAQYEGNTYLYETAALNNEYFLTIYADPSTSDIKYISADKGENMAEFVELTHSFDLRIFDIPEGYEIVKIPDMK